MDDIRRERRGFLVQAAGGPAVTAVRAESKDKDKDKDKDKEVCANEDLMRRALLVYRAAAVRPRNEPARVPADALAQTAQLFRTFGED